MVSIGQRNGELWIFVFNISSKCKGLFFWGGGWGSRVEFSLLAFLGVLSLGKLWSKWTSSYVKVSLKSSTPVHTSLLDKVMSRNQWHIGVHQHHLLFKGHWRAPHKTIYGHKKKVCLDKTFPLGHFMLHFIMFLICQITTKASNGNKLGPISLKHNVPMYARLGLKLVISWGMPVPFWNHFWFWGLNYQYFTYMSMLFKVDLTTWHMKFLFRWTTHRTAIRGPVTPGSNLPIKAGLFLLFTSGCHHSGLLVGGRECCRQQNVAWKCCPHSNSPKHSMGPGNQTTDAIMSMFSD